MLICFFSASSHARQPVPKRGGVCFRMDDNRDPQIYRDLMKVFAKYDAPFGIAANLQKNICKGLPEVWRELQGAGHEVMDHTPLHTVLMVKPLPGKTADDYAGRPGVDHIKDDGSTVCLCVNPPDFERLKKKPVKMNLAGDTMSKADGSEFTKKETSAFKTVYIPALRTLFCTSFKDGVSKAKLSSIWGEKNVNLEKLKDVDAVFVWPDQLSLPANALKIVAETSVALFKHYELNPPLTYIQPGGTPVNLYPRAAKEVYGDIFGYKSGANYPNAAKKVFCEYADKDLRRFGMQWGNFDEEGKDVAWNKSAIANGIALHHVMIGHSHLNAGRQPGGWPGYLERLDQILAWCREKDIPIHTQSQWADILYGTPCVEGGNIFPQLYVDLDENGFADGYQLKAKRIMSDDLPSEHHGVCLSVSKPGPLFTVRNLGGIDKGLCEIGMRVDGLPGDTIVLRVSSYPVRYSKRITLACTEKGWQRLSSEIDIPDNVSVLDISADFQSKSGDHTFRVASPFLQQIAGK